MQIAIIALALGLALSATVNAALVKRLIACEAVQPNESKTKSHSMCAETQSILDEVSCGAHISFVRRRWGASTEKALTPPSVDSGLADRFGLTDREKQVATLMLRGYCNARIADDLVISQSTVKSHAYNIFRKLDVHSRQEVIDLYESKCTQDVQPRTRIGRSMGSGQN